MSKGKRKTSVVAMMAVLASLLLPVLATTPAQAAAPINVNINLNGCDLGTFQPATNTCLDTDYKNGNLGKNWNELDLVPYRIFAAAGNQGGTPAVQTYTGAIVLDAVDGDPDRKGYDVISAPVKNTALSTGGPTNCAVTSTNQLVTTGFGGVEQSIYRLVTITQAKNTLCVFDWYGRLALGSHLFPGSSLHANLASETLQSAGGAEEQSIPVGELTPPGLRKTMTAVTEDSDNDWQITKTATPATLPFGNVCDPEFQVTRQTSITIEWTKTPIAGDEVLVTTQIYAKNNAARELSVAVTDDIRSGTTVLNTATTAGFPNAGVAVPANTEVLVLTHSFTVPVAQANSLNDIAQASFIDTVTGVPIPGVVLATASAPVQGSANDNNATASIQDIETLSAGATGLQFSVAAPSVGTFAAPYTAGDKLGPGGSVTWNSGTLDASGSVTFVKTVYLDTTVGATSGTLSDTATLTTSGNVTAQASASVAIDADPSSGTLTIHKTTQAPADGDTVFTFNVKGGALPAAGADVFVTVPDGTFASVVDGTLNGLGAGTYSIEETGSAGYAPATIPDVTFAEGDCAKSITVDNTFGPATATALKVTDPVGGEENWTFQLFTDNDPVGTVGAEDTLYAFDLTDATGLADFGQIADEGAYYISEVNQAGYVSDGGKGTECFFTIDYPTDADRQVSDCTFTNTQNGSITLAKVTSPSPDASNTQFPFTRNFGTSPVSLGDGDTDTVSDLAPGTYSAAENVPAGWTLTSFTCSDGSTPDKIELGAGENITCMAVNTEQNGTITVVKVTDPASDTTTEFEFTTDYKGTFKLKNGDSDISDPLTVNGGPYSVAETGIPAGWDLKSLACDGNNPDPADIHLEANENVVCTATNVQRGTIIVKKVTDPASSNATFDFTGDASGTIDNTQEIKVENLVAGTYTSTEAAKTGWTLKSIGCSDLNSSGAGSTATFRLEAGETVTCTFTNEQKGTIEVRKTVSGGTSAQTFVFELRQGASDSDPGTGDDNGGTLLNPPTGTIVTANNQFVQLNGFLTPGVYQVCELLPSAGWASNLGGGPPPGGTQFTLTLNQSNERVCTDVTVSAGENEQITVDNTPPPGGGQLTIGFWKNHASCKTSSGKQAPVLDTTLAQFPIESGQTKPGFFVGTLYVDTCTEAVRLLDKSTVTSNKKMASDPAFNAAAQFVAAKLNIKAGADTCGGQANTLIQQTQTLLVAVNFNGVTATYASGAAGATQKSQLNALAAQLDLYNNGLLC